MLANLINAYGTPTSPSVLLVLGTFGRTINILHLLPEDGTIERYSLTSPSTTFHNSGATEQTREQIGAVTLHVGDGETTHKFLDDVETRIRKLWNDSLRLSPAQLQTGDIEIVTPLVQEILQPAALSAIRDREDRDRSMKATQTYSVFVVRIKRSRARLIPDHPTSIS